MMSITVDKDGLEAVGGERRRGAWIMGTVRADDLGLSQTYWRAVPAVSGQRKHESVVRHVLHPGYGLTAGSYRHVLAVLDQQQSNEVAPPVHLERPEAVSLEGSRASGVRRLFDEEPRMIWRTLEYVARLEGRSESPRTAHHGHSLGASSAVTAAHLRPEHVAGVYLWTPIGNTDDRAAAAWIVDLSRSLLPRRRAQLSTTVTILADFVSHARHDVRTAWALGAETTRLCLDDRLAEISGRLPCTLIGGTDDYLCPPQKLRAYAELLGASAVLLPRSGHELLIGNRRHPEVDALLAKANEKCIEMATELVRGQSAWVGAAV